MTSLAAVHDKLCPCAAGWTPQRTVEEQFRQHNPWLMSALHLWPYLLGSLTACVLVVLLLPRGYMALAVILASLLLPSFTAITTIPVAWYSKQSKRIGADSMRELRRCMRLECFGQSKSRLKGQQPHAHHHSHHQRQQHHHQRQQQQQKHATSKRLH